MASRTSSFLILFRSWYSNEAVEDCGKISWLLISVFFITSSIALAVPFGANVWHTAETNAKISSFPGIGSVILAVNKTGISFSVYNGKATFLSETPEILSVQDWTIIIGEEGPPQFISGKTFWFGKDYIGIQNPETGATIQSSLVPLEGFSSIALQKACSNKQALTDLVSAILYATSFSSIGSTLFSLGILIMLQNFIFIVIITFLYYFVQRRKIMNNSAKISYLNDMKCVICCAAGPAFLIGTLGWLTSFIKVAFVWLIYALLASIRILFLYTYHYKQVGPVEGNF